MALINCPECKKEISDKVKACPHCGYPFEAADSETDAQKVEITSVNIKPKNPKSIRNIIIGVVVVILVATAAFVANNVYTKSKEIKAFNSYIDKLESIRLATIVGGVDSEELTGLTLSVWRNTIFEERDAETDKYTRSGNGGFYDDFNISLKILFKDNGTIATTDAIEANQSQVQELMKSLQNPPEGLEQCYQTVSRLYTAYQSLTDLAIHPSGSLQTYSQNTQEKIDTFMAEYKNLETQIPEKK